VGSIQVRIENFIEHKDFAISYTRKIGSVRFHVLVVSFSPVVVVVIVIVIVLQLSVIAVLHAFWIWGIVFFV
jgi:hypothetical protein